jgi:polyphenol oxidase
MLGLHAGNLARLDGVTHRFFQRVGGTSPAPFAGLNTSFDVSDAPARVQENLARVRFQLGVGKDALFTARQVHGTDVVVVDADSDPDTIAATAADALVTRTPGLAVCVRTADCAPVLLALPDQSAVAVAHAGWRGAVGGVLAVVVAELLRGSAFEPKDVVAAVGPCIGPDAFEVGPEVVAAAIDAVGAEAVGSLVRAGQGDRHHLDLALLCAALLRQAGVVQVEQVGGCTAAQPQLYFSHRRDRGQTGRQLSAIVIGAPPAYSDETFR